MGSIEKMFAFFFLVGKGGFLRIGQFVDRCVELIKNDDGCWGWGWGCSTVLQVKGRVVSSF
jgi:hypothetical protein